MRVLGSCEKFYLELIKGQRGDLLSQIFLGILNILSRFYHIGISLRNLAYDQGFFKTYHPPVPVVISVGNLVCGGTGKTPVTLMLAQALSEKVDVAILSRGYKSKAERGLHPVMLVQGHSFSPLDCGDEPYLLSHNLPRVKVFVGKRRKMLAQMAAQSGIQTIVLDDGMQHRGLARDVEIVVLDGRDPLGNGYLLPRGLLREGIQSLKRADLVVVNHLDNHEIFELLKKRLSFYTDAPFVGVRVRETGVFDMDNQPIREIKNKKVGVFCGLAKPEYFLETVKNLNVDVVQHEFFPDHEIDQADLDIFAKKCHELNAEYLICTEKDKIKCDKMTALPILWLKMELEIVEGREHWEKMIAKTKSDVSKRT